MSYNLFRLPKARQTAYINLLKQILASYGLNKNYSPEYFPVSKKTPGYLLIEEIPDSLPSTVTQEKFNTVFFDFFKKKQIMLCEMKEESFTKKLENGQQAIEKKEIIKISQITSIHELEAFLKNQLIPNAYLTKEKQNIGVSLLTAILTRYDLDSYYRVELYPKVLGKPAYIFLRESTAFPPIHRAQIKFNTLLQDLMKDQLITYEEGKKIFPVRNTTEKQMMPVIIIKAIDIAKLEIVCSDTQNQNLGSGGPVIPSFIRR